MSRLSSVLVQNQVLDVTQIEQILQRQVILGGDLSTVILEQGWLNEQDLAGFVALSEEMEAMESQIYQNPDPVCLVLLDLETIANNKVIPVCKTDGSTCVATTKPLSQDLILELSNKLGTSIRPMLVLDFRMGLLQNAYYGLPLSGRLSSLQKKLEPDHKAGPLVKLEELPGPDENRMSIANAAAIAGGEDKPDITKKNFLPGQSVPLDLKAFNTEDTMQGMQLVKQHENNKKLIKHSAACKKLEDAKQRDAIIELFFAFAHQAFDFSVLMVVHGDSASGRLAALRGQPTVSAEAVSVPLNKGGLLALAWKEAKEQVGSLDDEVGHQLLNQLGRDVPLSAAAIPVILKGRVVMIFVGESGHKGVRVNRVTKIAEFTDKVSAAFERILLGKKYSKFAQTAISSRDRANKVERDKTIRIDPGSIARKSDRDLSAFKNSNDEEKKESKFRPDSTVKIYQQSKTRVPSGSLIEEGEPVSVDKNQQVKVNRPSSVSIVAPVVLSSDQEQDDDVDKIETKKPSLIPPSYKPVTVGRYIHVEKKSENQEAEIQEDEDSNLDSGVRKTADYTISADEIEKIRESATSVVSGQGVYMIAESKGDNRSARTTNKNVHNDSLGNEPVSISSPKLYQEPGDEQSEEEIQKALNVILSGKYDEDAVKVLKRGGEKALSLMIQNFPGPLTCDRFQEMGRLPRVLFHGSLLKALVFMGRDVVSHLVPLLDSFDSEIRFYSTFLFSEMGSSQIIPFLVPRVFDNDRQIRAIAIDIIRNYPNTPEYRQAVKDIADVLTIPNTPLERKRLAAEILGELKEPSAIEQLTHMLGSVDEVLAERCHKALVRITFNDHAFSERKWANWYSENMHMHRIEWAIDSINHKNEDIRRYVITELKRMIGHLIQWPPPPYDFKKRKQLQRLALEYWQNHGQKDS